MKRSVAIILLILAPCLAGCNDHHSLPSEPSPVPQSTPQPPQPPAPPQTTAGLRVFTESATGFSTSDLRDVQEQILQINTAGELIWTADGTRLPGYSVDNYQTEIYWVNGKICPQGCSFEVRFGTKDGERRAYLTVDYGHDNPGTVVDVDVVGGALVVTQTNMFPPGTPTLSGVVSEATPAGPAPVEGVTVSFGISSGWRETTTDRHGFYSLPGLFSITAPSYLNFYMSKEGYQAESRRVSIDGDRRLDIQLVRK